LPEPTVWVDEKPWKGDPKKITGLSADEEHKIVVAASGYVPKTFNFVGKQGETKKFKHVMPKASDAPPPDKTGKDPKETPATGTGSVRVNAKGSHCVNVTVNGAGVGPTPAIASVPAGTARVTCKREDGSSASQSVKVEPGGTARVSF
jgi:eukaryotic-like serine/threonine-protein kinase